MNARWWSIPLVAFAIVLFAAAYAWPGVALVAGMISDGVAPDGGWWISLRELGLIGRTLSLAVLAMTGAMVLAVPGALAVGRAGRLDRRPIVAIALLCVLLCPPMIYAFGWERLLRLRGVTIDGAWRCAAVWAMWCWPIPAVLIGSGWARAGRAAYEAALLDASAGRALLRVGLPAVLPHAAAGALLLMVVLLGEYGVPHAFGIPVFATTLLDWASNSRFAIDTAWRSLLPAGVAAAGTIVLWRIGRRWTSAEHEDATADRSDVGLGATLLLTLCFAVSWVLPIAALFIGLKIPAPVSEVATVYGPDILITLAIAVLAAVASAAMGVVLSGGRRGAVFVMTALLFGVMPGALIGKSLVVAYLPPALAFVYDSWVIIALCHVARFGWIGLLAGRLVRGAAPRELVDAARVDGAEGAGLIARVHVRLGLPTLAAGAGLAAALAIGDAAGTRVVAATTVRLVSHVMIEKFHRFEDGMLAALSLSLVLAAAGAAMALRRMANAEWRIQNGR